MELIHSARGGSGLEVVVEFICAGAFGVKEQEPQDEEREGVTRREVVESDYPGTCPTSVVGPI